MDCTSCEELRESAPNFVRKGLTDKMRENLANNEGYEKHNEDCEDLNLANDCLLGRMPNAIPLYDDCDWKAWARDFSDNVYQMMGSTIAAICGLWKNGTMSAKAFVNHVRDRGSGGEDYFQSFDTHDTHSQNWYMNANGSSYGNKVADRDYIVIISHCFNVQRVESFDGVVTWYSSGDTRSMSAIRNETGQHPTLLGYPDHDEFSISDCSWTLSTAIAVKKGEYVKSEIYCVESSPISGQSAVARIHQVAMTWIPANLGTTT